MLETVIGALLPIAVILLLGYFAGYHHDFGKDQAGILNHMVMLYALPLSLFSGLITTSLDEISKQKELAIGIFIGMIIMYFIVYLLLKYIFKQNIKKAALLALAITGPAVPFVGVSVLGKLFGSLSSIPISLASIYMNLFQVPLTIILLSMGNAQQKESKAKTFVTHFVSALKEPVVWTPILALIFVLIGVRFPDAIISSFDLLGKATGGVALFASGIVLFSYKVTINKTVTLSVIAKNIIIPVIVWGIIYLFGFSPSIVKETVLTLAIPTASIAIILSIQYNEGQQDISSILFISTIFSIVTMGLFIWVLPS